MKAVTQTAFTRGLLAFNMVFVPGFIIGMLQKRWMLPRMTLFRSVAELGIISLSLLVGLPMTVAAFEQEGQIQSSAVEKELQDYKMQNGEKP